MDSISKVEYNVRNLTTRSVTLFPTRAQVFRDIKDVPLRPGLNEITIFGLTPTVDEHSIKVEGSGNAIISDIAVESLPNRDIFEDIYPDSEEDKSDADNDDDNGADGNEEPDFPESGELKAAREHSEQLQQRVNQIADAHASTEAQHGIMKDYAGTLKGADGIEIEDFLDSYKTVADRLRGEWFAASAERKNLQVELDAARKETERLLKKHRAGKKEASRAWRKAVLAKTKAKIQEARREEERTKEKVRVREEREKFWPKKCYAVRIQLTSNAVLNTPMSSRRGSISSEAEFVSSPAASHDEPEGGAAAAAATTTCSLVLSYVTSLAFWTPSYDLQLSTSTGTGTLCFDAQLNNTTSESWSKCKITLSTSQVSSSSLEEKVPPMVPWHLTSTVNNNSNNANNNNEQSPFYNDNLTQSREERNHNRQFWRQQRPTGAKSDRQNLFGVDAPAPINLQDYQMQLVLLEQQNKKRLMMAREKEQGRQQFARLAQQQQSQQQQSASLFGQAQQNIQPAAQSAFGNANNTGGGALFGSNNNSNNSAAAAAGGLFGSASAGATNNANPGSLFGAAAEPSKPLEAGDVLNDFDFDSFLNEESKPESRLDFEESLVDDTGFTTTYDLPGLKTLDPRSNSSKQRVARINLNKIVFSHTVIAKYKPVAHLSARVINGSKLTLLRGPAGVTLDGSFMGRTNLPRCGSGESINLALGTDPTIRVTYPRPEAKRATTGFFTKEDIKIFERCIKLENTKPVGPGSAPAKPVKILVLDQIPVADSEKVRIELLKPEGLTVDGEWKEAGVSGGEKNDKEGDKEKKDQDKEKDSEGAKALAGLKKKGEINWTVTLKPGKALRLPLEYLVAVPIGEMAIQT